MYSTIQAANNKGADQTAQMCMLICGFVVRIWQKRVFLWRGSYTLAGFHGSNGDFFQIMENFLQKFTTWLEKDLAKSKIVYRSSEINYGHVFLHITEGYSI